MASPTCSAVVSLGELDLDLVLPGDVLDSAAFGPHDGAVVPLRDGHLHAHLRLLKHNKKERGERGEREREKTEGIYSAGSSCLSSSESEVKKTAREA